MATFLGEVGGTLSDIGDALTDAANVLGGSNNPRSFEKDGFIVPPIPSASGNGLPSSKIPSQRQHRSKRHIIHWFIPEIGVINMYINPQSMNYSFKKLVSSERTKGGFVSTYWGEELTTLNITGHTGSSGVEGLNVLYEIYRSEQLAFDSIGLTMASDAGLSGMRDLISGIGESTGGFLGGVTSGLTNGLLGLNPLTQTILPRNPATLASLAFGIELYYAGWVMRGYFTSFSFRESVEQLGLFNYEIGFTVTQRRGYRTNHQAWQRSANDGPSNNNEGGVPLSYGAYSNNLLMAEAKVIV